MKRNRLIFLRALPGILLGLLTAGKVIANETASAFPDSSIYLSQTVWKTDRGDSIHLGDLKGKVRVISMFFTQCATVCPMLIGELKKIEKGISKKAKPEVGFIMVTLDPDHDRDSTLARYRDQMGLNPAMWTLLTATESETREMAMLLGVEYNATKKGNIDHTGLIAVLDQQGRIVRRQTRTGLAKEAIQQIEKLVASKALK